MTKICSVVMSIAIVLPLFDEISWRTVGWIVVGCFGFIAFATISNNRKALDNFVFVNLFSIEHSSL